MIGFARGSDGAIQGALGYTSATESNNLQLVSNGGSGYLTFLVSSAERMRINYTGNVLIGTTTDTSAYLLDIAGATRIQGIATVSSSLLVGTAIFGSPTSIRFSSGGSTQYGIVSEISSTNASSSNNAAILGYYNVNASTVAGGSKNIGVSAFVSSLTINTTTYLIGFNAAIANFSTGSVSSAINFYSQAATNSGIVGTTYGVYL